MRIETTDPDGPLFRIMCVFCSQKYHIFGLLNFRCFSSFVKSLYLPQNNNDASINDNTALLMHKHLGVPMLFFRDQAPVSTYLTIGNAMFVRRDDAGKQVRLGEDALRFDLTQIIQSLFNNTLDGYYQFCSERDKRSPTHTWFSYSSEPWSKVSSYVIHQCPANTEKLILQCAKGSNPLILARPFSVDAFLLNDMVMDINFMLIQPRATLLSIVSSYNALSIDNMMT